MSTTPSATGPRPEVEVRRSKRRRRTVSAYRDGDRVVVMIPASLSRQEEAEWVETMLARLERSERRRKPSDLDLLRRAQDLSDRYLGGLAVAESVRWVDNQQARWGSCTPGDRTIRLSARLQGMPQWVVDPAPDDIFRVRFEDVINSLPGGGVVDPSPWDLAHLESAERDLLRHRISAEMIRLNSLRRMLNVQELAAEDSGTEVGNS